MGVKMTLSKGLMMMTSSSPESEFPCHIRSGATSVSLAFVYVDCQGKTHFQGCVRPRSPAGNVGRDSALAFAR